MLTALAEYFSAGHDLELYGDMAQMTTETTRMQRDWGFNSTDVAAAQVVIIHGSLVSAVPTVFWLIMHVFSNAELLANLREELLAAVTIKDSQNKSGKREVLVTSDRIEPLCPTLVAAFRETQRLSVVGTLHRRVLKGPEISGIVDGERRHYLLKKGTAVLVPVVPAHRNPEVWGHSTDEFHPWRFFKDNSAKASPGTLRNKAYFPFGGGRELCPGRNFATAEALGTLVVLVLGFDIFTPDGSVLAVPPLAASKMTSQTARPLETADLRAKIKRRQGWENVAWGVSSD